MVIHRTLFYAISMILLLTLWFTYLSIFKFRIWVLRGQIFKTTKKSLITFFIFYIVSLVISIIITSLILTETVYIGEYLVGENGERIDLDKKPYNVITSVEGLLSFIYIISSMIPVGLMSYYLFNSSVNSKITDSEIIEFEKNHSFKIEDVEKSYYVLKSSFSKKSQKNEKQVVFENVLNTSLMFSKISEKLLYKSIIKKTVSFILQGPISTPSVDFEKTTENLIMMYLIASIKIINKSSNKKISFEKMVSYMKGLTF